VNRRGVALALPAALLAACAGIVPRSIVLSEAELQAQLDKRFPMQRSLLDAFDVELLDPHVKLDAQTQRLATELTLRGAERRSGRTLQGRLGLDYGLRFEPADGSVRLVQPRVQSLQFGEAAAMSPRRAEALQQMTAQAGITLAERLLDDLVLYRVPDAAAGAAQRGLAARQAAAHAGRAGDHDRAAALR
jgi:hypothetical protein